MSHSSRHRRSVVAVVACPGKSAVSMRRWEFLTEVWVDMASAAPVGPRAAAERLVWTHGRSLRRAVGMGECRPLRSL